MTASKAPPPGDLYAAGEWRRTAGAGGARRSLCWLLLVIVALILLVAPEVAAASQPFQASALDVGASSIVDQHSQQYVNDLVKDYKADYGTVGVNLIPIITVPSGTAPVTVSVKSGCGDFTDSTGTSIPIPSFAKAVLTGTPDSPLVLYQPSSNTEWEFWQATYAHGHWSACAGGELRRLQASSGVFPAPSGLAASGISYLASTITEHDIAAGAIDHAVAIQIPLCDPPEVAPADRTDCTNVTASDGAGGCPTSKTDARYPVPPPGQPREGTWFRFPATMPVPSGLTQFGRMVFKAIQTYGAVVTDQACGVQLVAESPADWRAEGHSGTDPITASWDGKPEYQVVANLPWAELEAVDPRP